MRDGFIELAVTGAAVEHCSLLRDGRLQVEHPIAATFSPGIAPGGTSREEARSSGLRCSAARIAIAVNRLWPTLWFSTYTQGSAHQLAAIIAEVAGESSSGNGVLSENGERNVLNAREMDVLRFLVQGLTNKEIAGRMEVSESTVKNTFQQLFGKLGVRTRSQLVRVALEQYRDIL